MLHFAFLTKDRVSTVSEEQYIGIVKNQILVDVQGNDLLYQIFTSNILQALLTEKLASIE